jgi:hypothetical protein
LAEIETDQKSGVVSVNHQAGKNHFVISIPGFQVTAQKFQIHRNQQRLKPIECVAVKNIIVP